MFYVKQSESTAARKRVPIYLVDATDGFTPETSVTSPTIQVSKNGGTPASGTGTFTEVGSGVYYYEFSAGEIDTLGWVSLRVVKSGTSREYQAIVHVTAFDAYDGAGMGLSRIDATIGTRATQTSVDTIAGYIDTEVTAIKAKTDNLPASPAAVGDIPSASAIASAVLTTADNVETGINLRAAIRMLLAALTGKAAVTSGTTIAFKRADGTTTALTVVFDEDGNRTTSTVGSV